jgi:hypothetical protein
MHSTWIRLAVLIALPAALIGCGSDAPSLEAWQERSETICDDFEDTNDELGDDLTDAEDLDEVADVLDETRSDYEDFVDEMTGLGVPSDDGDDVEEFYDTLDQQLELYDELQAAAEDEDDEDVEDLGDEFLDVGEDYDELAEKLDIEDCVFG